MTDLEITFDAIRSDGGLVHIRTACADDLDGLRALHARASDRSIYLRFFSLSRVTADEYVAHLLLRPSGRDRQVLVATVGSEIVGLAAFDGIDAQLAEIGLLVADDRHHEGIGTLLVEHLASIARHRGFTEFVAEVLAENAVMIEVLRNIGFDMTTTFDHGTVRAVLDLVPTARTITVIGDRERSADAASLRALLAPRSVAVIGASPRAGSVGNRVLANIIEGGFTGTVYAVNPRHESILGVACVATPADLPVAPDLAVVAVPAAQVPEVVRGCGERGTRALLLLSSGFGETGASGRAAQQELVAAARTYGMRMVGPNCLGLLNTDPAVHLDATFAPMPMQPGTVAMLSQSGAFGIALLDAAARSGLGIAQFVSVGNKADVSGNDLLLAWESDPKIDVIATYLESIGDARRFARIASRVTRSKPVIAIKAGRTEAGKRAGQSHTAAAATSEVAVDALFAEAGVLRVTTMQEMLDAARVLAEQPLPAGPRVAVIGNSGGPGILAADAIADAGLDVVELTDDTRALLAKAVPSAASCHNPVDLGAGAPTAEVGEAVRVLLAADEVDAVLTVFAEVSITDPDSVMAVLVTASAGSSKPLLAAQVGKAPRSLPVPGTGHAVPVFTFPEPAAAALGVAHRYAQIHLKEPGPTTGAPSHADSAAARRVVEDALAANADWLSADDVSRLLIHYGIPVCPQRIAVGADEAARAAVELGYPLAVKVAGGVVHKSDTGGVRLGVGDESELRRVVAELGANFPSSLGVLLQPMAQPGTELIVGALQDPQFGPMVMIGAGGTLADILDDRTFRLAPLTGDHAEAMIANLRVARLLDGYRGRPPASRAAVRDVLVRVAALVHDIPEVSELDLNPLVCNADGPLVVDARIRVARPDHVQDPLERRLRAPALPTERTKL
jgi:acyl-CoA synthetase (NDP forming)/GNAT superfamily N-acetyltransferase